MKYVAFRDRQEPRDLFDLAHLTTVGVFNEVAGRLIERISGARPFVAELRELPSQTGATWKDELAHQTREPMPASEALKLVRGAVERLYTA